MGTVITAFTGHFANFLVCDFASDEFVYAGRHADGPEEAFQCFDTGQGCFFCRLEVVSYSHGIDGELCETGGIFKVDVTCPTAPYGGQARTVGYVEHAAEFVFQKVRGPV